MIEIGLNMLEFEEYKYRLRSRQRRIHLWRIILGHDRDSESKAEVDVFVVQRRKDFFRKEGEHKSTFLGGDSESKEGKGEVVYS